MSLNTAKRGRGDDEDDKRWKGDMPADRAILPDDYEEEDDEKLPAGKRRKVLRTTKPKPGKARRKYNNHPARKKNRPMKDRQEKKRENMANRTSEQKEARLALRQDPHNAQALEMFNSLPQTPFYTNHTIVKGMEAVRLSRATIEDPRLRGDSVVPSDTAASGGAVLPETWRSDHGSNSIGSSGQGRAVIEDPQLGGDSVAPSLPEEGKEINRCR